MWSTKIQLSLVSFTGRVSSNEVVAIWDRISSLNTLNVVVVAAKEKDDDVFVKEEIDRRAQHVELIDHFLSSLRHFYGRPILF